MSRLALVLLLALAGCSGKGNVRAAEIEPTLVRVLDRHDRLVRAAPYADERRRATDLRDAAVLREVLAAARESAAK